MTAKANPSKGREGRDGRTARKPFYTTLRVEPTGETHWKATEPEGDNDLWGRGETVTEAVQHYAQLIENAGGDSA